MEGHVTEETLPVGRWRAAEGLIWTEYDDSDECVVYVPASADIHHLTAQARLLWTLVSAGSPSSSEEIAARFATELGRPLDNELMQITRDALASMDRAGLVQPVLA